MRIATSCYAVQLLLPHLLFAGGPLLISEAKDVCRWDNTTIKYSVDRGPIGEVDEDEALIAVKKAFACWSEVSEATLDIGFEAFLPNDVQDSLDFLLLKGDASAGNIVIFDHTGDIISDLAGLENRDKIMGFAEPVLSDNRISRFYALMNGAVLNTKAKLFATLLHEFGHSIGLDHTQINASFARDGIANNDINIPIMFPTSTDDDSKMVSLRPDDLAWCSWLYQAPSFASRYGIIKGRLVRGSSAVAVNGANVVAISQSDPILGRFSCVSDFRIRDTGEFEIPVQGATMYRIEIEPILPRFIGGSSVGPYAISADDVSFVDPVQERQLATSISVAAGQTVDLGDLRIDQ